MDVCLEGDENEDVLGTQKRPFWERLMKIGKAQNNERMQGIQLASLHEGQLKTVVQKRLAEGKSVPERRVPHGGRGSCELGRVLAVVRPRTVVKGAVQQTGSVWYGWNVLV